jgi:hypothetical protein
VNSRLDHIINLSDKLKREATLARVGLEYSYEDDNGELVLPAGTSAHVHATKSLLTELANLA